MRQTIGRTIGACGLLLAACALATAAGAQTGGEGLSPTLANIKKTHVVRLGYRESSPPFSFLDQANRPIGYSLELCEAIVDEIGVEVDDANLQDRLRQGHLRRPHSGGGAEQDRPRMRIDHGQRRARQAGGVLAADVRGRHQADGAEGVRHLGGGGPQGQDRGGDQGHHQRAGDARRRQEARARPQHHGRRPITSSPTRCWSTARPMRSRPTTSCSTA